MLRISVINGIMKILKYLNKILQSQLKISASDFLQDNEAFISQQEPNQSDNATVCNMRFQDTIHPLWNGR